MSTSEKQDVPSIGDLHLNNAPSTESGAGGRTEAEKEAKKAAKAAAKAAKEAEKAAKVRKVCRMGIGCGGLAMLTRLHDMIHDAGGIARREGRGDDGGRPRGPAEGQLW